MGLKELFRMQTVLVTGATGLIGKRLVYFLLESKANVVVVVRDIHKARLLFGENSNITYIVSDISELKVEKMNLDYIIHGASNTASKAFVENPVGVINTSIEGTKRTLEIARLSKVKGYVFLSSMEVYGTPDSDEKINESYLTDINTMNPRSSYPESKRMCENLCASYYSQYGVLTKVIRLTQSFGPGVTYNDSRVFAEFARCAIEGRDIILHTMGETKRCYLHIDDAVTAILKIATDGVPGEAYNAANEETYCSIYQMAEFVAKECSEKNIRVIVEKSSDTTSFGYAPVLHMNLETSKIRKLGWKPSKNLRDMFFEMIDFMKEQINYVTL